MDQLSILVLADQHVGSCAPVPNGNHELSPMPKGQDDSSTLSIQRVHMFGSTALETEHRAEQPNEHRPNRGQQGEFEPSHHWVSR